MRRHARMSFGYPLRWLGLLSAYGSLIKRRCAMRFVSETSSGLSEIPPKEPRATTITEVSLPVRTRRATSLYEQSVMQSVRSIQPDESARSGAAYLGESVWDSLDCSTGTLKRSGDLYQELDGSGAGKSVLFHRTAGDNDRGQLGHDAFVRVADPLPLLRQHPGQEHTSSAPIVAGVKGWRRAGDGRRSRVPSTLRFQGLPAEFEPWRSVLTSSDTSVSQRQVVLKQSGLVVAGPGLLLEQATITQSMVFVAGPGTVTLDLHSTRREAKLHLLHRWPAPGGPGIGRETGWFGRLCCFHTRRLSSRGSVASADLRRSTWSSRSATSRVA